MTTASDLAIQATILSTGLAAVFNATSSGLQANITHIAFGDGGSGGSYEPTGSETQLRREITRVPVGGGERIAPNQIHLSSLLEDANIPEFWINEVGIVLEDGTMLALWSKPGTPLGYKSELTKLIVAFDLVLSGVPANSVDVTLSGPSVNILFVREMVSMSGAILKLQLESIRTKKQAWDALGQVI